MQYKLLALSLAAAVSAQVQKGFNYGATFEDGACRSYNDFKELMDRAKNLPGASGFSSARLYTTIQCGTDSDPISAIQAAVDSNTNLLLGMWASAGSAQFDKEVTALKNAINQYGSKFADRVVGISVGSEDLYRASDQGKANNAGVGADANAIKDYIGRVRQAVSGTSLSSKPIGHVDTWTAWVLPENAAVAEEVDFLGHNSFPYFETTKSNPISKAKENFQSAVGQTESAAKGKPVWITETGWPHSGPNQAEAVASVENAQTYWREVGCPLFGSRNTWWYTLEDANTNQADIAFGITPVGGGKPVFDLSCSSSGSSSSSSSSSRPSSSSAPAAASSSSSQQSSRPSSSAQGSSESSPVSSASASAAASASGYATSAAPTAGGSYSNGTSTGGQGSGSAAPSGGAVGTGYSQGGQQPSATTSGAGSETSAPFTGAGISLSAPVQGSMLAVMLGAFAFL